MVINITPIPLKNETPIKLYIRKMPIATCKGANNKAASWKPM